MTATRARRTNDTAQTGKTTAYGRQVLRVLKEMQRLGPWKFGPRISDRIFRK